jgi:hypothetical protein
VLPFPGNLAFSKVSETSFAIHQLSICSALRDHTLIEYDDTIRLDDGT